MSASTLINRFRSNESGTTAIIFGVSVVAMLGALGAAMDISRAVSEKSRVQTVADIASLQAARSLDGDDAQLLLGAQAVFAQHFPSGSPATVTGVVRNGDAVTVEAESRVDTYLAGFLGFDEVPVSVESTSTFAVNDVDIALVLDTTGSMAGSKMAALKTAAGELIDTLEAVDGDGIRLSVVPFAQHVNVGLSRAGAEWLDVPADRTTPASRECRLERPVIGRSNCRTVYATGYSDGVPFDYSYQSCDKEYGEEQEVCRDRAERTDIWQGCVGSRDEPLDTQAAFARKRSLSVARRAARHSSCVCGRTHSGCVRNMRHGIAALDHKLFERSFDNQYSRALRRHLHALWRSVGVEDSGRVGSAQK